MKLREGGEEGVVGGVEVEVEMTAMEPEEEEGGVEGEGREAVEEAPAVLAAVDGPDGAPLCGSVLMAHSMLSLLCSRPTMVSTGLHHQ